MWNSNNFKSVLDKVEIAIDCGGGEDIGAVEICGNEADDIEEVDDLVAEDIVRLMRTVFRATNIHMDCNAVTFSPFLSDMQNGGQLKYRVNWPVNRNIYL